jgi:hypothetical protein
VVDCIVTNGVQIAKLNELKKNIMMGKNCEKYYFRGDPRKTG